MPRKKKSASRRSPEKPQPVAASQSAAESLFRATYGRDMTDDERRSTVSNEHPLPLKDWVKQK